MNCGSSSSDVLRRKAPRDVTRRSSRVACVTTLPYKELGYIRFISERTSETLFEIKMFRASMLIWGAHYRPSEFKASLAEDGASVRIEGMLCDRIHYRTGT